MSDLSTLAPIQLDPGKATWLECRATGLVKGAPERTHGFGIPEIMPATIIFVHGVNSEGEWYEDAAQQFAVGLNMRLGREDLEAAEYDKLRKRFSKENSYAWHDEDFWRYLLDLADWKRSDPYWQTGDLSHERANCAQPPAGVDTETVGRPSSAASRDAALN